MLISNKGYTTIYMLTITYNILIPKSKALRNTDKQYI